MSGADETAIRIEHVSKDFILPHEKINSVKSLFTSAAKKRGRSKQGKEVQHALKDISFEIKKGEFFGIVGRNGSGKSTLLKILAGIYQPTTGKVATKGKLVPFIELGVGFNAELTGRENVYLNGAMLGFSKKNIDDMYDAIVSFAELERFMDQKLKNYSSGMQVRLAFSLATRAEADVLLVDEVLAVGDADFQRKCFEYFKTLKKNKKTVVFVSHDMNAVKEFCDRAALIDKNELQLIGSAEKVGREYSLLFMNKAEGEVISKDRKRWGNGKLKIKDVSVSIVRGEVIVSIELKVNQHIDKVIYGLHILGQDGVEITAMNNRMINEPDLSNLTPGSNVILTWKVLNVFNDGNYFINVTFVDDTYKTLDWYIEAATFTVKRADRSTTAVLPPVMVEHTINKDSRDNHGKPN